MKKVVFVFIVLILAGNAFAMCFYGGVSSDWGTLANWESGTATALPAYADDVYLYADATIAVGTTARGSAIVVGWDSWPVAMDRNLTVNGTLITGWDTRIAWGAGTSGLITVNAGGLIDNTDSRNGGFIVGWGGTGYLQMNGGVLNASSIYIDLGTGGTGHVQLDAGTITIGNIRSGPNGTLDITGGTLIVTDWINSGQYIQDNIDSGWITAYGGNGVVKIDATNGVVTATGFMPSTTWNSYPAMNETVTSMTPVLSWKAGTSAVSYDVYFGTDVNTVATARRPIGDFNNDRVVDMADLSTFVQQWLSVPAAGAASADFDASGTVDMNDFALIAGNWQTAAAAEYKGNQAEKPMRFLPPLPQIRPTAGGWM